MYWVKDIEEDYVNIEKALYMAVIESEEDSETFYNVRAHFPEFTSEGCMKYFTLGVYENPSEAKEYLDRIMKETKKVSSW